MGQRKKQIKMPKKGRDQGRRVKDRVMLLMNLFLGQLSNLEHEMRCGNRMVYRKQGIQSRRVLVLIMMLIHMLQQLPLIQSLQVTNLLRQDPPPVNNTSQKSSPRSISKTLIYLTPTPQIMTSQTSATQENSPHSTSRILTFQYSTGMSHFRMTNSTQGTNTGKHIKR